MPAAPVRRLASLSLLAICCAVFMTVMDSLIVSVALESIQRALGAGLSRLQWVVDAYTLTYASFLLAAGSLGDRLGYRRVFMAGLWVFTLASIACGLAPGLDFLVAGLAVQGLGAALLLPNALSLLNHLYTDPATKAKAIGIWGCCSSAGASAGPVVGGCLVGAFGWRGVFFVNVPFCALTYLVLRRSVPECRVAGGPRPFDWLGQSLGVLGLASLTYALIEGRARGLGAALPPLAILAAAGTMFLLRQRRGPAPMVPPGLVRVPAWINANAVAFLVCFAYYGFIFMASLYFQSYRHFSPMLTGLCFLPMTLLQPFLHPFVGRWVARIGPRVPMILAQVVGFAGLAAASCMDAHTSRFWLGVIMMPIGLGSSLSIAPSLVSMLRATPPAYSGAAGGIFNTARQTGALLGVACLGALLGPGAAFLPGFHVAVLVGCALMAAGALSTLAWAQRGSADVPGPGLDEDLAEA
jgi:DHA2 family methylenomycin A resistance protein-like MFS transporter